MKAKAILATILGFIAMVFTGIKALANPTPDFDLGQVLGDGISGFVSEILPLIGVVVLAILPVIGIVMAVRWAIRFFKGMGRSV
jgi:amino acid transporter